MPTLEHSIVLRAERAALFALTQDYEAGPGQTRVAFRYHFTVRLRWLGRLLAPLLAALFARDTRLCLEALRSSAMASWRGPGPKNSPRRLDSEAGAALQLKVVSCLDLQGRGR